MDQLDVGALGSIYSPAAAAADNGSNSQMRQGMRTPDAHGAEAPTYRTLLVHVEPTEGSDSRVDLAVDVAQQFDAVLIGVGGRTPAYIVDPWICSVDGMAVQLVQDREDADLAESEARFRARAHSLGGAAIWRSVREDANRALLEIAAGADLVLAGPRGSSRDAAADVGELVMHAGVPVLSTSEGQGALDAGRVLIAWKNTPEARRAVTDALPFLKRAKDVLIVQVAPQAGGVDGLHELVERLRRHGVTARVQTIAKGDAGEGAALVGFIDQRPCDLVVAGAFGHSRARQWVFGGVTQSLLEQSKTPVLFSR